MFRNIYQSIKNNLKDSMILMTIIFILLNFMFIVINAENLNRYIINNVKNSIKIREVFNLKSKLDSHNKIEYCNDIINNLSKTKEYGIITDFSILMDDRLINRDLGISFSAISVLDEDSLDYYGYHLIDGEYLKDQKNHNYINILMSQRIADALGYAVDSKIELEIKNDIYNFNVVGLYDNQEVSSLIHNPSITPFIDIVMTNDDMMNILNESQGEFKFENVAFRYKGIENMDKYEKYIIDIFKISQAKYYSDIEFEYDLNSNIKTIEQLVLPLNNATIIFNMMTILLIVVAFIILFASIGYIIKNRLKDLAIFIALGQTKLKTIVMVIVEMGLITFLAIILTIPTSLISYNKIKDIFLI